MNVLDRLAHSAAVEAALARLFAAVRADEFDLDELRAAIEQAQPLIAAPDAEPVKPRGNRSSPKPPTTKACKTCKQTLPATDYARHGATRDGLQPNCRSCSSTIQKQAWAKRRDATPPPAANDGTRLTATCPRHGTVAETTVTVPAAELDKHASMWLATVRSRHRSDDRCESELQQGRS